jgi:glycosyltransferase involved in cell wall biosynthesis
MCVYNAGDYLRPSLLSIINQTYGNLDILIIDDGSTDGCFESIRDLLVDPRIRVIHQANSTKPVAMNRALDQVRGEFYAIQDADDISYPTRIETQVGALLKEPKLAAVFCGNDLIIGGRPMAPICASKSIHACQRDIDAFRMPAHDPTGMFRLALVGHLRYEPSLKVAETFDYIMRIGEQHPMMVLGECLYGYRILPGSLTRRAPMWREKIVVDALRRACERRGVDFEQVFPEDMRKKPRSRNSLIDNNIAAHFISSALSLRQADRKLAAVKAGWQCARLHPADPHYYKALIYAVLGPDAVDGLRRAVTGTRKTASDSNSVPQHTGSSRR